MAKSVDFNKLGKKRMALNNALVRGERIPVDSTAVYKTYDEASAYALEDARAYKGQIIYVEETDKLYKVTEESILHPDALAEIAEGEGYIKAPEVPKSLADFIKGTDGEKATGAGVVVKDSTEEGSEVVLRKLTLADFVITESDENTSIVVANSNNEIKTRKLTLADFATAESATNIVSADSDGKVEARTLASFIIGDSGIVTKDGDTISTRKLTLADFAGSTSEISEGDIVGIVKGEDDGISVKKLTLADFVIETSEGDKNNAIIKTDGDGNAVYSKLTLADFANMYNKSTDAGKVITMNSEGDMVLQEMQINWTEYETNRNI